MLLGLRIWWGDGVVVVAIGLWILGDVDRMEGVRLRRGLCGRVVNV